MGNIDVLGSFDYRSTDLTGVGQITFYGNPSQLITAEFNASQFGGTGISNSLTLATASGGGEGTVEVFMSTSDGSFSAKDWTAYFTDPDPRPLAVIVGSTAADAITGADDIYTTMIGGGGADSLHGGAFGSSMLGGTGNDRMFGGPGSDTFVFNTHLNKLTNVDHIGNFVHGQDKIALSHHIFGAHLTINANTFYAAPHVAAAHDATDRIVYNKTNGGLYFDADGKGGAASVEFAVLSTHPASLGIHDFIMVA